MPFLLRCVVCAQELFSFLQAVGAGYLQQPYHNALHGADVAQTMYYFLSTAGLSEAIPPEAVVAAVIAACAHDVVRVRRDFASSCCLGLALNDACCVDWQGHLGVSNAFLVATKHPLAIRYNDKSVLENMHAATTFDIMRKPENDIFAKYAPELRQHMRTLIVKMILGTDNAKHFKMLAKLNARLGVWPLGSVAIGRLASFVISCIMISNRMLSRAGAVGPDVVAILVSPLWLQAAQEKLSQSPRSPR